jgi:glycosyltransferase involved in cell wall biosynthesis
VSPLDARGESDLSLSVIVSTYEAPEALDAVLRGLADQSDPDFEVVVADDGSGPRTKAVVERWADAVPGRVAHVWQPDVGSSHIAAALNRGALAAFGDFLVVLSGDCVPRRHFVRAIRGAVQPGWFVAANWVRLSPGLTERVLREPAPIQRWSTAHLLLATRGGGPARNTLIRRDRRRVGRTGLPDFAPHNNSYCCIGVDARDFAAVNGFDTRFVGWGDEDVDLATRLRRFGLRCGHGGADAVPLHLWHESRRDAVRRNWSLLKETEQSDRVEAVEGLRELAGERELAPAPTERSGV